MSQPSHQAPSRFDVTHRIPTRWLLPATPVSCTRCGEEWMGGDPAFRHDCPDCGSPAGQPCSRPAGGNENVCASRDRLAERDGVLSVCPSLSWTNRHSKPSPFVCTLVAPAGALPIRTSTPAPRWAA